MDSSSNRKRKPTTTRRSRTTRITRERIAGIGGDGNLYGVVKTKCSGKHLAYLKEPCSTCPWSTDSTTGTFPAQAFRQSAPTAYDAALSTFACHESGIDRPGICAGFLLANSDHNLSVRLAIRTERLDIDLVRNPENAALYGSYREMAIANGVDPDDPVLAPCRANDEEFPGQHAKRAKRTHKKAS